MAAASRSLAALALVLACACGTAETTGTAFLNAECPLMGNAIDEKLAVEYGDGKVGFCCAKCIPKWEALSDEEKQAQLAKVQ